MRICHECGLRYTMSDTNCGVDGHKLHDTEDLFLGEVIGSYRVARLLGEGGMGRVYLGVHPQIKSRVAIKVLTLQASCHAKTVERFFAEAQSVNRIRHDGIVKVLDLSHLPDGRPYILMEYLDGFPLSHWLSGALLPLAQLREYVMQMLAALEAVHQAGIVHRDLKPDNIFVSPQGTIRLLDFGIAKLLPEYQDRPISSETQSGTMLGTPHYMAPEQIEGGPISPATDIYSIGAILYEAVTGQTAFRGDSLFALFACVMSDAPVPPQQFRSELSASMQEVILRALAKNPGERFSSAREMASALAAAELLPVGVSGYSTTVPGPLDSGEHGGSSQDSLTPRVSAAHQTVQPPRTKGRARLLVVGGLGLAAVATIAFLAQGDSPEKKIVSANTMIIGDQLPENTSFAGYSHASPKFDVKAFDADGEQVTYALSNAPVGMTINALSGRVDWFPVT
ncbi:MAG: serine/threonine protein kinase, partial [Kofleriaceae bacterium]|nr:serine/threonine protein kinase [Kofleriaceae bacterium]